VLIVIGVLLMTNFRGIRDWLVDISWRQQTALRMIPRATGRGPFVAVAVFAGVVSTLGGLALAILVIVNS
jgi:hypothetical protein